MLDYNENRYCSVYGREITADLCYESMMCFGGIVKASSIKEMSEVKDINVAERICDSCKYSDINDGLDKGE